MYSPDVLRFWRSPKPDEFTPDPRLDDEMRRIRLVAAEGRAAYWQAEVDRLRAKLK